MAGKTKRLTINVTDKNGNKTSETRDIYARGLWNTQEIKITGAVEGQGVTDFEDGKGIQFAVTQGKDSVGTKALQSGAVTLDKISDAAKNGTIQDNDNKLATHAQVKTYVDAAVTGKGTYLGKKSVAEINALDASKLNNSDRVMTSDGGTITLGGFDVIAGTDLILYKDGSTIRWDSMDGNFKTKQVPISSPVAEGKDVSFIDTITQNENGDIYVTKKNVREVSDSASGLMSAADKKKIDGIASGAEVNVQADWNVTDSSSDAYIKNKPKFSSADGGVSLDSNGKMQVNGWNTVAKKTDVTQEISNAITSEATARQDAIDNYVMFTSDEVESIWNEVMAV
jgi:hypothetical protein